MKDFNTYLVNKYPSLFPVDVNGDQLQPICGIYCPEGWEEIVDNLCGAIVDRTTNVYHYRLRKGFKCALRYKVSQVGTKLFNLIVGKIKPYKNLPKLATQKQYNEYKKKSRRFQTYLWTCKILRFRIMPNNFYEKIYSPPVTIDQIKEKFGGLRFYYEGGDEIIRGMVEFAEYLAGITCEVTGKRGELCIRGGWYKTLDPETANEKGYSKATQEQ